MIWITSEFELNSAVIPPHCDVLNQSIMAFDTTEGVLDIFVAEDNVNLSLI